MIQIFHVFFGIFSRLATFGGGADIIGPEKVVERMKRFLDNAAKVYKKDGEM